MYSAFIFDWPFPVLSKLANLIFFRSNEGNGQINYWILGEDDQYISGDFDKNGADELLVVNHNSKWSHLYEFNNGEWQQKWSNEGNEQIKDWVMEDGDQYVSGNFDNDNADELLIVNHNSKQSHLYEFSVDQWQKRLSNEATEQITNWLIGGGDQYVSGDFDKDGMEELFCVSTGGWGQLYNLDNYAWNLDWANDGSGTIQNWFMAPTDKYFSGKFENTEESSLFVVSQNGWTQIIKYDTY